MPAGPGVQAPAFLYQSTSALRRSASEAYVARVQQRNPAAAALISSELGRHDYDRIYTGIVAPYGYRPNDAADGLAAYTLLGWLIANGQADIPPRQAAAVRAQIAFRAAGSPVFASPASRAQLGEELKLLFVTLHAGWQSARREGTLRQYADGVAIMFRNNGTDLRALRLSDSGFAGR
ncbi:MAG: hypothetical protein EON48_14570 [Acetobacteraceae bacterium]|nr:MAG: hypothetical protein EON48_14570 [Acetobacteraceae bacterium]